MLKLNQFQNWIKPAILVLLLSCPLTTWADGWKLTDKDGIQYQLAGQKGKWVLVNFWAPWCPPCVAEMPELNSLQRQHKDLLIIGVAVMYHRKQEVLDLARKQALSYPIIMGNEDIASEFGGMEGLPTTFLYSPSGQLLGHHDGPLTQNEVEQIIAQGGNAAALFVQ